MGLQSRADFGNMNPVAFVSHPTMFDFYHGGGRYHLLRRGGVDAAGNVRQPVCRPNAAGQGSLSTSSDCQK